MAVSEFARDMKESTSSRVRTVLPAGLGILVMAAVSLWGYGADTAAPPNQPTPTPVPSISYQHPNHIHGLGYDSLNQRLFVATHYGIFIWKEGGLFQLGKNRDDYMGFSLHPSNPSIIYTSGHPGSGGNMGVMKSEDGGLSFRKIFGGLKGESVDFHSMALSPVNPNVLYGWFQGKIYRTKNGGKSWTLASGQGLPSRGFCFGAPCLSPDSRDERLLYAGTGDGLFVSRDFGENWSAASREGAFAGIGVDPVNAQRLFAFTQKWGVAISPDGGKSWQARNKGVTPAAQEFIFAFAFDPKDSKHVFAATPERVFRSSDRGESWEKIL